MTATARPVGTALLIVASTALIGVPTSAAALIMRLDGARFPTISTVMLAAVAVHAALGLWLTWSVLRPGADGARTRYLWWVASGAAVIACVGVAIASGFTPSGRAILFVGVGILGVAAIGRALPPGGMSAFRNG